MKLGIDIDGVLADFVQGFTKKVATLGYKVDASSWGLGLTDSQQNEGWKLIDQDPDFWYDLAVIEWPRWHHADVVYYITKRRVPPGRPVEHDAAAWLCKHIDERPFVISTGRKGDVCNALEIDAFIDDKPENCQDVIDKSPRTQVFLRNQPWNQDSKIQRVNSVGEFLEQIG